MKVKVPRRFSIGATNARVGFVEYLHSDEGYNGTYNKRTGELQIEKHLNNAKRDRTFGHELMEVIKENYDLGIPESDMTCVANGWLEFLWQLGIEFSWEDIK